MQDSTRLISSMLLASAAAFSQPAEADSALLDLIGLLRDKGSITAAEYQALAEAVRAEERSDPAVPAEDVPETPLAAADMDLPEWSSKILLKGDARLRYQAQDNDPGSFRDRGRLRYRLGITARPTGGWEVGAGLASGSSDLRSTNQSFTGTFSSKPVQLDYAYARYAFGDRFRIVGGKFKYPDFLYTVSDLLWDGDINPEGFSAGYSHPSPIGTTFASAGLWVLEENSGGQDPHLVYGQLGQEFSAGNLFATAAASYYGFRDIDARDDFATAGSNTDYRFNGVYSLSGEIGMNELLGGGVKASLVADWVVNPDTIMAGDSGYLAGVKASRGPWSFRYLYADLQANAWPDILPDSDRFDGLTGVSGHEIVLEYKLNDYVLLGLDYYAMDRQADGADQDLLQIDLNVKF